MTIKISHWVMFMGSVGAAWLSASEPMVGPYPALMASPPSHYSVSRPIGFDPGYGE
jgi:hypothetical protein